MDSLEKLLVDISNHSANCAKVTTGSEGFELRSDAELMSNLKGGIGTLLIRNILNQLNLDEHHVFQWRLENKYIQYSVLNHYLPDLSPATYSLSQILNEADSESKLQQLINNGFFLKAVLGHSSGKNNSFDRTAELQEILNTFRDQPSAGTTDNWILQRKMHFIKEFRIHTFNTDVINGLTFRTQKDSTLADFAKVESFTEVILKKIPESITCGTLIGWDIGITTGGDVFVIEANFTGFHPEHHVGFQTSGYFQDNGYGPIACAWFNMYIKSVYGMAITSVQKELIQAHQYFRDFMFYDGTFKNEQMLSIVRHNQRSGRAVIIHLQEEYNDLLLKLVQYFIMVGLFGEYYLITPEQYISENAVRFSDYGNVKVYDEYSLLKKGQSDGMTLTTENRKEICCRQLIPLLHDKAYIIV
jgi:hypothetical protein